MTLTEQRRWIWEFRTLQFAVHGRTHPDLDGWEFQIVPGRSGEFSLLCMNPEARAPLVYIAIQRDTTVPSRMLHDWAEQVVTSAIGAAAVYVKKELWRQMPLPEP